MNVKRLYQIFHWLSLDVVAGAVVSYRVAAHLPDYHGAFDWPTAAVLGMVVFAIYTLDRLIDNRLSPPATDRHRFRHQYRQRLVQVLLAMLVLGIVALFFLPPSVLWWGLGLALTTVLYLFGVFRTGGRGWFEALKDVAVPLVYALGVWGTATVAQPELSWEMLTLGGAFWLIAQQNLLLVAYFESFTTEEGHSLPIRWGELTTRRVLQIMFWGVVLLAVATVVFTSYRYPVRVAVVLMAMASVQHWLWQHPNKWLAGTRYRNVSEAVFLLPLLVW